MKRRRVFSLPTFQRLMNGHSVHVFHIMSPRIGRILSRQMVRTQYCRMRLRRRSTILSKFRHILVSSLRGFPISHLVSHFFSLLLGPGCGGWGRIVRWDAVS